MAINLLTNRAAALAAIASVEGQGWLAAELQVPKADHDWVAQYGEIEPSEYSLRGVLAKLDGLRKRNDVRFPIAILYGSGGYHRYLVYADGRVWYSRQHGVSQVNQAEAAGIEVLH